jgi:hypothetical protein
MTIVFAYFSNIIPPIPLSVKAVHPYYLVERVEGVYLAERESRGFAERFLDINGESLKLAPGAPAYVFSSIFAPANFSEQVVHRWQFYDDERAIWQTAHTVQFPIIGGRDGGYRGFSYLQNPAVGRWRVSIETSRGQVIGRTYFTIERRDEPVRTELFTL